MFPRGAANDFAKRRSPESLRISAACLPSDVLPDLNLETEPIQHSAPIILQ